MSNKILVVDDETEIEDLIEVYLKNENYCIRRNPVAAFAAVSGHGAERVAGVLGV